MENFNLKKFLVVNKLTTNSKMLNEDKAPLTPPVNPITKEVMEDFENASQAIKKLKSSLENKEFTPGIHDPKKGIEVQRTKEEFIKEIQEIESRLNFLSGEYGGILPKGFKL